MTEQPENSSESPHTSTDGVQQTPQPEPVKSPDFRMVYVNNVSLHATAFDMHLTFGELYRDTSGQDVLEQRITLGLSLQTAKILAALIAQGVANYESAVGEVKLPPGMLSTSQTPNPITEEPSAESVL